jgi:hypothetical protein
MNQRRTDFKAHNEGRKYSIEERDINTRRSLAWNRLFILTAFYLFQNSPLYSSVIGFEHPETRGRV